MVSSIPPCKTSSQKISIFQDFCGNQNKVPTDVPLMAHQNLICKMVFQELQVKKDPWIAVAQFTNYPSWLLTIDWS